MRRIGILSVLIPLWSFAYSGPRYMVERVTFQYKTKYLNEDRSRCIYWGTLDPDERGEVSTTAQDDIEILVPFTARMDPGCKIRFRPADAVKEVERVGLDVVYQIKVKAPATLILVEGDNFKDQLLFEAPIQRLDTKSFFSFFKKSRVYFETRFSQVQTNNANFTDATKLSSRVFPIFGGNIGVPFPWWESLIFGFSMFQNLGNFKNASGVVVNYSDFAFSLRYYWTGAETSGRPLFGLVGEYSGRSIYQTQTAPELRPYVIGSISMPGFGFDSSWYPMAAFLDPSHWSAKIGLDLSTRYWMGSIANSDSSGAITHSTYRSYLVDACLNYRLGKKWALGVGYSYVSQSASGLSNIISGSVKESLKNYFVRLSLVPYPGVPK